MKFLVTGVNGQWGHDVMNENYIKEDMKVSAQILLKLMPVLFIHGSPLTEYFTL